MGVVPCSCLVAGASRVSGEPYAGVAMGSGWASTDSDR
nr:MAG TPA: hypothetical protein [Caudoviricetes sp.]